MWMRSITVNCVIGVGPVSIANGRHVGDTGSIAKTQSMGECIKSIFEDSFVEKGF